MQRAEEGLGDLGTGAHLALEAEEGGIEDREVLARVLHVDPDELGGDLELHQRAGSAPPGLTGS